jgi:hypothetical protein
MCKQYPKKIFTIIMIFPFHLCNIFELFVPFTIYELSSKHIIISNAMPHALYFSSARHQKIIIICIFFSSLLYSLWTVISILWMHDGNKKINIYIFFFIIINVRLRNLWEHNWEGYQKDLLNPYEEYIVCCCCFFVFPLLINFKNFACLIEWNAQKHVRVLLISFFLFLQTKSSHCKFLSMS